MFLNELIISFSLSLSYFLSLSFPGFNNTQTFSHSFLFLSDFLSYFLSLSLFSFPLTFFLFLFFLRIYNMDNRTFNPMPHSLYPYSLSLFNFVTFLCNNKLRSKHENRRMVNMVYTACPKSVFQLLSTFNIQNRQAFLNLLWKNQ